MRESQKKTVENFMLRADLNVRQVDEIAMLLASHYGPITISSLIEHGLKLFRSKKRKAKP